MGITSFTLLGTERFAVATPFGVAKGGYHSPLPASTFTI
jgi:hypothetical protein